MLNNDKLPRQEYPRPQMKRENWLNLNGVWDFEIDQGKSGRERKLPAKKGLENKILVPFCPESKLSGIEHKNFMEAVWYKKTFELPEGWLQKNVLLHFGAVDYKTEVWVNGCSVGTHQGGYTPFTFEIKEYLKEGKNQITVCAEDNTRSAKQPSGKQSTRYDSHGCCYTRTTGIWQTVWLESTPETYIQDYRVYPDAKNAKINLNIILNGNINDELHLKVRVTYKDKEMTEKKIKIIKNNVNLELTLKEKHLWKPDCPEIYDMKIILLQKEEEMDSVIGYFGLRDITITDNKILINGQSVFQRLVLDQGYYPDGIYTAPSDDDLKKDIEIAQAMGFNGARLHQKVFEPRFLYWADIKGYLVWGEYGSWGFDITKAEGLKNFLPEWLEAVERDFNHPSLIGWCPFNETWDMDGNRQDDQLLKIVYEITKKLDKTRPVIDTSGNYHVITDVFDIHDYEQDPDKFASKFSFMKSGNKEDFYVTFEDRQQYGGQPYFVSEYGGIWWNPEKKSGWGYGERPKNKKEFIKRYRKLTETLLNHPEIFAFCYTQLYDIEQEVNGLYTYERKAKFSPEVIRKINSQIAEIEK